MIMWRWLSVENEVLTACHFQFFKVFMVICVWAHNYVSYLYEFLMTF